MKTFEDLEFKPHSLPGGVQARMDFDNGYGVSVVGGYDGLRGDGVETFEVAVFFDGWLCYDSGITEDVENWQTKSQVTDLMRRVQELPAQAEKAAA